MSVGMSIMLVVDVFVALAILRFFTQGIYRDEGSAIELLKSIITKRRADGAAIGKERDSGKIG